MKVNKISSGILELDKILKGGFVEGNIYMIRGGPGTGKTTLGLYFLSPKNTLFINLGENEQNIKKQAKQFGFNISDVEFLSIIPRSEVFEEGLSFGEDSDLFFDTKTGEIQREISDKIEEVNPNRVFIDSLTYFKYASSNEYHFREQVQSLFKFLREKIGCTTLFTSQCTTAAPDDDLQFMADGVIHLDHEDERRTLEIWKNRLSDYQEGTHGYKITNNGLDFYPKPIAEKVREYPFKKYSTGVKELDELLHGGIEKGTTTLITGPSGVGKSTLGASIISEAAKRNEKSKIYLLEENKQVFYKRCEDVNIPLKKINKVDSLEVKEIGPKNLTIDEFSHTLYTDYIEDGIENIMVDPIAGYFKNIIGEEEVKRERARLLLDFARKNGITTTITVETPNITGDLTPTKEEVSGIADNLILLKYLELNGELKKSIGILKKRMSDFERQLKTFKITNKGIKVGEKLEGMKGILKGVPEPTTET